MQYNQLLLFFYNYIDVNTFHSLWNNSVSAITQSTSSAITTPTTVTMPTSLPSSPFVQSPAPLISLPFGYQPNSLLPSTLFPSAATTSLSSSLLTTSTNKLSPTNSGDSNSSTVLSPVHNTFTLSGSSKLQCVKPPESLDTANQIILAANETSIHCVVNPIHSKEEVPLQAKTHGQEPLSQQETPQFTLEPRLLQNHIATNLCHQMMPLTLIPQLQPHALAYIPIPSLTHPQFSPIIHRPTIINPLISPFSLYRQNLSLLTIGENSNRNIMEEETCTEATRAATKQKLREDLETETSASANKKRCTLERSYSSPALIDSTSQSNTTQQIQDEVVQEMQRTDTGEQFRQFVASRKLAIHLSNLFIHTTRLSLWEPLIKQVPLSPQIL